MYGIELQAKVMYMGYDILYEFKAISLIKKANISEHEESKQQIILERTINYIDETTITKIRHIESP